MAIYEHVHVLPHRPLIIEDVPSGARVSLEDSIQNLSHRLALDLARGTVYVALDVRSKSNNRHFVIAVTLRACERTRAGPRGPELNLSFGPLPLALLGVRVTSLATRLSARPHEAAACSFWFSAATLEATSGGASA